MSKRIEITAEALQPFVHNILSVYHSASLTERHEGLSWYSTAGSICTELGATHSLTRRTVACLIALLSPQKNWAQNVDEAQRVLAAYSVGGEELAAQTPGLFATKRQRGLIRGLLSTELSVGEILKGQKIQSFWKNILGDEHCVTVDGHARNIADHGVRRVGISQAKGMSKGAYALYSAAYVEAAHQVGVTPAQLQAITWVAYRNL